MPRVARIKSQSGIYHVMLRGINRQIIFEEAEDNEKFLEVIKDYKKQCEYKILGYCLMGNHVHIIIKEEKEELHHIMKRIASKYAYWYNTKYQRAGHLFQDRFKSEPIENEKYLFTVLRYIHQNPVNAGIVTNVEDYKYSSYKEYISKKKIVDIDYVLEMIPISSYVEYHKELGKEKCLDMTEKIFRVTDEEAIQIIKRISKCENLSKIQNLEVEKRNRFIKKFRENGISIRQISRLTGISKTIIEKCSCGGSDQAKT